MGKILAKSEAMTAKTWAVLKWNCRHTITPAANFPIGQNRAAYQNRNNIQYQRKYDRRKFHPQGFRIGIIVCVADADVNLYSDTFILKIYSKRRQIKLFSIWNSVHVRVLLCKGKQIKIVTRFRECFSTLKSL